MIFHTPPALGERYQAQEKPPVGGFRERYSFSFFGRAAGIPSAQRGVGECVAPAAQWHQVALVVSASASQRLRVVDSAARQHAPLARCLAHGHGLAAAGAPSPARGDGALSVGPVLGPAVCLAPRLGAPVPAFVALLGPRDRGGARGPRAALAAAARRHGPLASRACPPHLRPHRVSFRKGPGRRGTRAANGMMPTWSPPWRSRPLPPPLHQQLAQLARLRQPLERADQHHQRGRPPEAEKRDARQSPHHASHLTSWPRYCTASPTFAPLRLRRLASACLGNPSAVAASACDS